MTPSLFDMAVMPSTVPTPAKTTARVMAEAAMEPGSSPGSYVPARQDTQTADTAESDQCIVLAYQFALIVRNHGLSELVAVAGGRDNDMIACARLANEILRGVASDRPAMTSARWREAIAAAPAWLAQRKAVILEVAA